MTPISQLRQFLVLFFLIAISGVSHSQNLTIPAKMSWAVPSADGGYPLVYYGTAVEACSSPEFTQYNRVLPPEYSFDHTGLTPNGEVYTAGTYCWFKSASRPSFGVAPVSYLPRCPSGFNSYQFFNTNINGYISGCEGNWVINPKNNGVSEPKVCNPINPATGNKYQIESDYVGSGLLPLSFRRTYNSGVQVQKTLLNYNWSTTFDRSLGLYSYYGLAYRADGKILYFDRNGSNFTAMGDISDKLTTVINGSGQVTGYKYISSQGDEVETFDAGGKLQSVTSRSGLTQTLSYDTQGNLTTVTDSFGRALTFTFDATNRLATMADPQGGTYLYAYDEKGNLKTVTYPGGGKRTYHYNEPAYTAAATLEGVLTGITDENNVRYATYQYDSNGKAISTEHAGGADKATLTYGTNSTSYTDPLGTSRTYNFQTVLGAVKAIGQSQPSGAGCGGASSTLYYDGNGNIASSTDFNGNVTTYVYDLTRNLETSRTEAAGTSQARTITTQWHATYRLPIKVTEPKRTTTFSYDASGNLLSKTVQDMSAGTTGSARSWSYTYNARGQVLTMKGPRTDVNDTNSFIYDAQGNLSSVTNSLGHVTTLTNYDGNGRIGRSVDSNGLTTDLQYHPRGWLLSKTVTGNGINEASTYDYDGVGQLKKVSLPDGSFINYSYDDAHRLTSLSDSLGNGIRYTLDAMGNRIKEEAQDPNGVLARQVTRVYDALNRVQTVTGDAQ